MHCKWEDYAYKSEWGLYFDESGKNITNLSVDDNGKTLQNARNVKVDARTMVIVGLLNVALTTAVIGRLEYAVKLLTLHLRIPSIILVANQVIL